MEFNSLTPAITENGEQEYAHCDKHSCDYPVFRQKRTGKTFSLCPECDREDQQKRNLELLAQSARDAERAKSEEFSARIARSGVPVRFACKTLANYLPATEKQREVLDIASEYAMNHEALNAGRSLLMNGSVGTGKTHLATAILIEVIAGNPLAEPIYTTARDMIRSIRDTWGSKDARESSVIERYATASLLVIDEIGVQYGSDSEAISMFEIIDKRYGNRLPTVFVSNLSITEIKTLLGDRVIDRLREDGGVILNMNWKSHRGEV